MMIKTPWHDQPGKRCLSCGEEELQYKWFGDGKAHCMHCLACKSTWWARKEDEAKRQYRHDKNE